MSAPAGRSLIGADASGLMRASSPPDRVAAGLEGRDDLNSHGPLIGDRAANSTLELVNLISASMNSGLIGVAA